MGTKNSKEINKPNLIVPNEEYGLCEECKHPNSGYDWCQLCNAKHFQQNFNNWTSKNHDIDKFIQNSQLKAKNEYEVLEWIEYYRFENVEYLVKGNFVTVYKSIWKDGPITSWDSGNNKWKRTEYGNPVVLECLKEDKANNTEHVYGITKDPETNKFMMVIHYISGLCMECYQPYTDNDTWSHQSCNAQRFQQNFNNWTSESHNVDEFIQNAQLKANNEHEILEWIEYDRFETVKNSFGTVYKAIWKDGPIVGWDSKSYQWKRSCDNAVTLKCSHNSVEILKEIKLHIKVNNSVRCYGITKDPATNNFMIVTNYISGLCIECYQPYTTYLNHQSCNAQRFQRNFKNWTSKNYVVDKFIQNSQLKAKYEHEVLEWIEYNKFVDVKYLAKGNFGTVYKAFWKEGPIIVWDSENYQWKRSWYNKGVTLKCLHNFNSVEILKEIKSHINVDNVYCYGITKNPETNNFMIVMRYEYGLCIECNQPYTNKDTWNHRSCYFQQNFKNWTSKNNDIDKFIQNSQLKAKNEHEILEWIEYDKFKNVKYLAKGDLGPVYKAIWKDGPITNWDSIRYQWIRSCDNAVILKCLHNSVEILREIQSHIKVNNAKHVVHCYGITKDPETNNFMIVMHYKFGLCIECNKPYTDNDTWNHQSCNAQRFQQNFNNWTSENHNIDEFIQNVQLKAKNEHEILEWVEYDRFENVNGSGTVFKAIWKDGPIINWDSKSYQWKRSCDNAVILKCLHNSVEILKEIQSHIKVNNVHCYGITKDPETNNFMIVMHFISGLCMECYQPYTAYWNHQTCNAQRFQQNFKNWTSENHDIDKFIQNSQLKAKDEHDILEWIEYNRFENIKYLAKGGFGIVYNAIWKDGPITSWDSGNHQWKRLWNKAVALKCLHNSQEVTVEFLREIELHLIMNNAQWVVTCYGITKDPKTNNFMMVMQYAENGSLRQHLNDIFYSKWERKLRILHNIANGLKNIHDNKLIHRNFHCGNILNFPYDEIAITDLGICRPANVILSQNVDKKIYGVLPYVAPEVLRGKEYTQASDVYGFGIIACEVFTGLPPYHDMAHEEFLAIRICQGLRPKSNYKIPPPILDIIKQCWDADPLKRPKAEELVELLPKFYNYDYDYTEQINKELASSTATPYTTHPQAVYTSRFLDYKNLPEPKNADDI